MSQLAKTFFVIKAGITIIIILVASQSQAQIPNNLSSFLSPGIEFYDSLPFRQNSDNVARIENRTFDKAIHIKGRFKTVVFKNCVFESDILISGVNDSACFEFDSCKFKGIHFAAPDTLTYLSYYQCIFFKNARFRCTTTDNFTLMHSVCQKEVSFYDAKLSRFASFLGTDFFEFVDFAQCVFGEEAFFDEVSFGKAPSFFGTTLPNKITINGLVTEREIDLTSLLPKTEDPNYKHRITMYGASIDHLKINYSQFVLDFDDPQIKSFDQQNNVYLTLLAKQRSDGFVDSYKNLDLEYRKFYSKNIEKNMVYYWLNKLWWNFGYDKWLVIFHTGWLLLLFSIVSAFNLELLVSKIYVLPTVETNFKLDKIKKRSLFSKLPLSIYFTSIIFFGLKLDTDNLHLNHHGWVFYILLVYTTGLLCTAFLFNYIITV